MVGNQREGWGSRIYKNGSKYNGNWQEGKRNGYGTFTTFEDHDNDGIKAAPRPKLRYTGVL